MQVEAGPAKPGAGALAALAAALQSSADVDPGELHSNASAGAAALRARLQKPSEAKPRWGVIAAHGAGGSSPAAELSHEMAAVRDAGAALDSAAPHTKAGKRQHAAANGTDSDAVGWVLRVHHVLTYIC